MAFPTHVDDPHLRHLFDLSEGAGLEQKGAIRLTAGAPGPSLLRACAGIFQQATKKHLEQLEDDINVFQYGITPGSWEFRDQLAKFLTESYGDSVNRSDLILTCGATHGLQIILNTILAPGGAIFVEEATYMIALDVFKEFPSSSVIPIKLDDDGLDVDDLSEKLTLWQNAKMWNTTEEKPFWAMVYCIPVFQNPSGTSLKEDRCKKLVDLARKFDVLVFCDDVYNLLAHGAPPKRVFYYDRADVGTFGGHVVSNGTFSKILAPGIRVGWLEAPPRIVQRLKKSAILRSSGAVNHYMSSLVTTLMQLGLQQTHLNLLRETFMDRMVALMEVLDKNLPPSCRYHRPGGGYYVWLQLPQGTDAAAFCEYSLKNFDATAFPGKSFSESKTNCLRMAVAFHEKEDLVKAGESICRALNKYLSKNN